MNIQQGTSPPAVSAQPCYAWLSRTEMSESSPLFPVSLAVKGIVAGGGGVGKRGAAVGLSGIVSSVSEHRSKHRLLTRLLISKKYYWMPSRKAGNLSNFHDRKSLAAPANINKCSMLIQLKNRVGGAHAHDIWLERAIMSKKCCSCPGIACAKGGFSTESYDWM